MVSRWSTVSLCWVSRALDDDQALQAPPSRIPSSMSVTDSDSVAPHLSVLAGRHLPVRGSSARFPPVSPPLSWFPGYFPPKVSFTDSWTLHSSPLSSLYSYPVYFFLPGKIEILPVRGLCSPAVKREIPRNIAQIGIGTGSRWRAKPPGSLFFLLSTCTLHYWNRWSWWNCSVYVHRKHMYVVKIHRSFIISPPAGLMASLHWMNIAWMLNVWWAGSSQFMSIASPRRLTPKEFTKDFMKEGMRMELVQGTDPSTGWVRTNFI